VPRVSYRERAVAGPLGALVECGWSATAPAGGPADAAILPDGCMDLIWTGRELLVAGPDTGPHPHLRSPGATASGLRFRPGRLPALLGVPADRLRDQRVPLAELHPSLARATSGRLGDAAGPGAVLDELAALARALPGTPPDPAVRVLTARIDSAASAARIADSLGWTTRTLHRHCLGAFGYGPAVLRRVLRFRRATGLLGRGVPPAEVAARLGYADQPHLSREVRALGGASPRGFGPAA
jgi:AraC-like DNA-binding protein